jgi:hypothetical protein
MITSQIFEHARRLHSYDITAAIRQRLEPAQTLRP